MIVARCLLVVFSFFLLALVLMLAGPACRKKMKHFEWQLQLCPTSEFRCSSAKGHKTQTLASSTVIVDVDFRPVGFREVVK